MQSAEAKVIEQMSLPEFFGLAAQRMSPTYGKALASWQSINADSPATPPTADTIAEWVMGMLRHGLRRSTVRQYLNCMASLHHKALTHGLVPDTDREFASIKARLANLPEQLTLAADDTTLASLRRMALNKANDVYADMCIYSLLGGAEHPDSASRLTRSDIATLSDERRQIAERHADPHRKYVFPLDQGRLTPAQLSRKVHTGMATALHRASLMRPDHTLHMALTRLWASLSLRCGISAAHTLAAMPAGPGLRPEWSTLFTDATSSTADSRHAISCVATALTANPMRWWAMRLRPGVTFDRLRQRLAAPATAPELFYPCREIARRTGRRLTYREQPLIADVVFFRCRLADVAPLFNHIGDLAWCYRHCGTYAHIPDAAMTAFQTAIAIFTPDTEIAPAGTLSLNPGDRVIIIGGEFAQNPATILSAPAGTVYRLQVLGINGIEWKISLDSRLLRKA